MLMQLDRNGVAQYAGSAETGVRGARLGSLLGDASAGLLNKLLRHCTFAQDCRDLLRSRAEVAAPRPHHPRSIGRNGQAGADRRRCQIAAEHIEGRDPKHCP